MFNRISEENFRKIQLPKQSSLVNYSRFKELETDVLFRSFSIKYVIEGCEKYRIYGNQFKIQTGEYLLANNFSGGHLIIDNPTMVEGMCIDIAPSILTEVVSGIKKPDLTEFNPDLERYFTTNYFPENKYNAKQNALGKRLEQISQELALNTEHNFEFTNEFFYDLAEKLVIDQYSNIKDLNAIPSVKLATKKDLFRKIALGKNFIDSHFSQIKNIEEVALECSMSEYHFFRLFRHVYQISPYQYILKKKLELAYQLLKDKALNISEVAFLTGFNDLPTFSKSFKKQYGLAPSIVQNKSFL